MKHLGDITKLDGHKLPLVDIVTGGSPCQDLSVAGKRAGLAGARSGLFMEQIRIIKEMRDESAKQLCMRETNDYIRPRYMVWENVPGAFSSNKGEDFRAVLEETAKVCDKDAVIPRPENGKWTPSGCIMGNGWSIAWRVHDAQFWGVPQRRKRIALVADFGGDTAPKILFESESLSRDSEQSETERKEVAGSIGAGIDKAITFQERGRKPGGGKGILIQNDRTGALSTVNNQMVFDASRRHDYQQFEDVCETVQAHYGSGGGNVPMVVNNTCKTDITCLNDQGGSVMSVSENVVGALRAQEHGHQPIVFEPGAASRVGGHVYEDGIAGTVRVNAGDNQQAIVYGISSYNSNAMKSDNPNSGIYEAETTRTLDLNGGNPACNQGGMIVLEGNGSRPSHRGDGYAESDTMYTLNGTEHHAVCVENHPADSRVQIKEDGVVQTLSGRMGTGGGNVPLLMDTYQKTTGTLMASGYDKLGTQEAANDMFVVESQAWDGSQVSPTLTANNAGGNQRMPDKDNFNAVVQCVETFHCTIENDKAQTLKARDYKDPQCIAYGLDRAAYNQGMNAQYDFSVEEEKIATQVAKGPGAVLPCTNSIVRRLTPMECERLQGYPDHWTDIGEWTDSKGKKHKDADSPRYKALGNSIALPFWEWMAKRMVSHLITEQPTMASLFDGIGGFPLVYSRAGCEPIWASEIEEFPIAVTKIHFPE